MKLDKITINLGVAVILSSAICVDSSDGPIPIFLYEIGFVWEFLGRFPDQFTLFWLPQTITVFALIALQTLFVRSLIKSRLTLTSVLIFICTPLVFVYYQLYQAFGDLTYYLFDSSDFYYAIPFWILSTIFIVHVLFIYGKEKKRQKKLISAEQH